MAATPGAPLLATLARLTLAPHGDPGLDAASWRTLLALAITERCAALAWTRAEGVIVRHAPRETAAAWRRLYVTVATRGLAQIAAAADAAAAVGREGIVPVTLKGVPLAAWLYGDPVARSCTDIDWWLPAADRPRARRALDGDGWVHNEGGLPWDETLERRSAHGTMYLELHSTLLHRRFAYLPVPEPEHEPMLVEGTAVRRHAGPLVPGYLAAHLAQHTAPPLLWDVDFATLWQRLGEGERLEARRAARSAGLGRYLRWAIARAERTTRLAEGRPGAARRLGYTERGRRDVHPAWRHLWLAPSPRAAVQALDGWLRPSWTRDTDGAGVGAVARRIVRNGRAALARPTRVGDRAPGDGLPVRTDTAVLEGPRLLEVARGVVAEGGEMWIIATGESMTPAIAPGDHVRLAPPSPLAPGDIVLAENAAGHPVLHRVRRLDSGQVVLRGDACRADDAPLARSAIVARVAAVTRGALVHTGGERLQPAPYRGVSAPSGTVEAGAR